MSARGTGNSQSLQLFTARVRDPDCDSGVMTGSLYGNFTGEVCVFITKFVFLKNHSSC